MAGYWGGVCAVLFSASTNMETSVHVVYDTADQAQQWV